MADCNGRLGLFRIKRLYVMESESTKVSNEIREMRRSAKSRRPKSLVFYRPAFTVIEISFSRLFAEQGVLRPGLPGETSLPENSN